MSPDIQFGVVPALTTLGLLVIALVIYVLGPVKRRPRQRFFLVEYIYWVFGPIIALLARLGVTPNAVTTTSLFLSILAGLALAKGWFFVSAFVMGLTVFCDIIDGNLARKTGLISKGGAFLDSFIDRLAEGALFLGIAYFGGGGYVTVLAVLALITSFAVSYARARGESLGVDVKVGFAQRPVRMFIIIFAILFSGIFTWMHETHVVANYLLGGSSAFIALISAQTSFVRVRRVMSRLDEADDTKTPV
jgi:CDP-diacylglycerol--glycerol-3-phosphate 3-phosphatidyltransferase